MWRCVEVCLCDPSTLFASLDVDAVSDPLRLAATL